jgi:hypothetical protein
LQAQSPEFKPQSHQKKKRKSLLTPVLVSSRYDQYVWENFELT